MRGPELANDFALYQYTLVPTRMRSQFQVVATRGGPDPRRTGGAQWNWVCGLRNDFTVSGVTNNDSDKDSD